MRRGRSGGSNFGIVAVASRNPVKLQATLRGFRRLSPGEDLSEESGGTALWWHAVVPASVRFVGMGGFGRCGGETEG